jgi:hypothetical protein
LLPQGQLQTHSGPAPFCFAWQHPASCSRSWEWFSFFFQQQQVRLALRSGAHPHMSQSPTHSPVKAWATAGKLIRAGKMQLEIIDR